MARFSFCRRKKLTPRVAGAFAFEPWELSYVVKTKSFSFDMRHRKIRTVIYSLASAFALYRDDGSIDEVTWIHGVQRGQFRLHPAGGRGLLPGCITLSSRTDFLRIRAALVHTNTIPAGNSRLNAYGTIQVIAYGNTCP